MIIYEITLYGKKADTANVQYSHNKRHAFRLARKHDGRFERLEVKTQINRTDLCNLLNGYDDLVITRHLIRDFSLWPYRDKRLKENR